MSEERWLTEQDPNGDVLGDYLVRVSEVSLECVWCHGVFLEYSVTLPALNCTMMTWFFFTNSVLWAELV